MNLHLNRKRSLTASGAVCWLLTVLAVGACHRLQAHRNNAQPSVANSTKNPPPKEVLDAYARLNKDVYALVKEGNDAFDHADWSRAEERYDAAIRLCGPKGLYPDLEACIQLGRIYIRSGRLEQAVAILSDTHRQGSDSGDTDLAIAYYLLGQYDKARQLVRESPDVGGRLREYKEDSPDDSVATGLGAQLYVAHFNKYWPNPCWNVGDTDDREAAYRLEPDNPKVLFYYGGLLWERDDLKGTLDAHSKALSLAKNEYLREALQISVEEKQRLYDVWIKLPKK